MPATTAIALNNSLRAKRPPTQQTELVPYPDEKVDVARKSRVPVIGNRVTTDDYVFNADRVQQLDKLSPVLR